VRPGSAGEPSCAEQEIAGGRAGLAEAATTMTKWHEEALGKGTIAQLSIAAKMH
jgi:hypothetical protein